MVSTRGAAPWRDLDRDGRKSRGAFYGDERQGIAPQDLFDERDAQRALQNLDYVAAQCARLLDEATG